MDENIRNLLGDDVNVKVENIDKYIAQQGVVVRFSVGGGRNSYYISPKIYGVKEDELSDDSKQFMGEHIRDGRISFVPRAYEKKLRAIESKLKKKLREVAVGYEGSFVPLSSYPELKEYYEECQDEYFTLRDELVKNYPHMFRRFVEIAKKSIEDLNAYEAEEELVKIIAKIPNQQKFKESFKMDMAVSGFPTMENLDMFDVDIQEDIKKGSKKNSSNLVLETTISVINEGIASLSSVLRSGIKKDGRIHQRVLYGVNNGVKRMGEKNIFANPILDGIKNEMSYISKIEADSAIELAEKLIAKLYGYASELRIEDAIDLSKCPFTEDELIAINKLYS